MRALSLYHPWAALVAIGAKQWETRPRSTSYRGKLAIQAALKWDSEIFLYVSNPPFVTALDEAGLDRIDLFRSRGHVVAICDLTECITSMEWNRRHCRRPISGEPDAKLARVTNEKEYQFGDYSPGRFAYKLENIQRLRVPYKLRGFQGMWSLTPEQEADILDLAK